MAIAVLLAGALVGCQSTAVRKGESTTSMMGEPIDVTLIAGTWKGKGKRDGARRTLEVRTDEAGNAVFRYCYQSQCRRSSGHTLTHQVITPTKIDFRWNGGPLFRFQLDGAVLRGTRGNPDRPINIFPMRRTES